ncbi:hypothetical protein B0T18DRAFT_328739 [Schizothecium vesticola]|uniref:Uncharacterized protein n=1 Tax=Schizothecium vesticola TaxID=314040 RepID=A0AA40EP02_9PEZI|nr:hypothetical protein B0T18DRAFT_328739 [Schizothecium vesticola]
MNHHDSDLLDAFRGAALSVTKLYKTASQHLAKARADGYQDCLEDLILFLDKESFSTSAEDAARIRRWAAERQEGRETISQSLESEDEVDNKPDAASSPVVTRASIPPQPATTRYEVHMKDHSPPAPASAPPTVAPIAEVPPIVVPSRDVFTFQSTVPYPPYPQDISLDGLDLSDSQSHAPTSRHAPTTTNTSTPTSTTRHPRGRNGRAPPRGTAARMSGQKRKVNLDEIFDLSSLGHGKDVFGNGKRSRLN